MALEAESGATDGGAEALWQRSEARWREAHAIASADPRLDPGDVYHALNCLDLTPAERLRRGLTRVRPRIHTR